MSIEPVESVLSRHPDEAATVLEDVVDGALGESVFETQVLKSWRNRSGRNRCGELVLERLGDREGRLQTAKSE